MMRALAPPLQHGRRLFSIRDRAVAPAAQVGLAAAAIAVLFGVLLVAPFPLWAGTPSGPPAKQPAASPSGAEPIGWAGLTITLVFVLAMWLPFRPYVLAQKALERARIATPWLIGMTILIALAAVLIYPALGSDIFDYVGFERMWVVYGDNPLLALPIQHPLDWSTAFVWYPDRTPAYGPLWALLTWPIVRLAGDSAMAEVAGYKLLSSAAYAACCWLIWTSVEPARRQRALVAFAWSPLVLFEVLGKVHNDILPALSMLAAVWLLKREPLTRLGLAGAVAGALVKVTALAAAPPVLVYLARRHGRRGLLIASALAALLVLALYAPFWTGPQVLASILNQTSRVVWSPMSLLTVVSGWLPGGPYPTAVRVGLGLACLAICLGLVIRAPAARASDLATTSGWVLLTSLFLLTSSVFAHYLVPAVALAAVSGNRRLERLVVWLSLGGLAAYGVEFLGLVFGPQWLASAAYQVVGTLMLLGPAAAMLAWRATTLRPRPAG